MQEFLSMLGPSPAQNAYVMYRVMDRREKKLYPVKTFWSDKWPSKIDPGREYFFTPVLRGFGRSIPVVGSVLWFDIDGLIMPDLPLLPSCLVFSGNGWHVYYSLDENYLADDLSRFVRALVPLVGSDPACVDPERHMRLPGSNNLKGPGSLLCSIDFDRSPFSRYSLKEVSNAYGLSLRSSIG